jgi:UDP-N-acetylglucosamine 2-epimerase (non-hydrolysing)
MKIMTILGTRPEIIRLSLVIKKLDNLCDHVLVHTGQNYDTNLNDIFFRDMNIREPDYFLEVRNDSFGAQIGKIIELSEWVMKKEKPGRLLILGDTNSSLSAIVAKRIGIPVFHMEAGNRCYDDRVPEEVNRRIIDHCSDILMPYTERSRMNLLKEGIPANRTYVTGNPIFEVISSFDRQIEKSDILKKLSLKKNQYILVTVHRAENVDIKERLSSIINGLEKLEKKYHIPVIVSVHPRTKNKLEQFGLDVSASNIQFHNPFGFIDFINLEKNAWCVISDSGTVQEECCIFHVPNVTIRDVTERPETIECGSNILSGANPDMLEQCASTVTAQQEKWRVPEEYLWNNVSTVVTKIILGYHSF